MALASDRPAGQEDEEVEEQPAGEEQQRVDDHDDERADRVLAHPRWARLGIGLAAGGAHAGRTLPHRWPAEQVDEGTIQRWCPRFLGRNARPVITPPQWARASRAH